jgi:hypothetical protein
LADLPPVEETGGPAAIDRLSASTPQFMESMVNQLPVPEHPDRAPRDEPFSAYLEDTAHQIRSAAGELRGALRSTLGREATVGNVACCVIFAIYRLILNEPSREATYDAMREVSEERVVEWVRVFRDLLINLRQVNLGSQPLASFQLNLLAIDVSGLIYRVAKSMLVGLAVAFMTWVETQIGRLNRLIADDLQSTRCEPIIRLWSAVLNWLYDKTHGLVGRLRGFVQDELIRMHRKIQSAVQDVPSSAGGSVSLAGDNRRLGYVDDIILVLDAIIEAIDVFRLCRLPPPSESEEDRDRRPRRDDPGRGGDDGGGGGGDGDDGGSGRGRPDPTRLTEQFDPDLGRVSTLDVPEPRGDDGSVFLTPTNVAKFVARELDADPEEARRLAAGQTCRDEISEETEDILQQIGVLSSE